MGTGCGATDMATILMTGELWFRVPEIIEVRDVYKRQAIILSVFYVHGLQPGPMFIRKNPEAFHAILVLSLIHI